MRAMALPGNATHGERFAYWALRAVAGLAVLFLIAPIVAILTGDETGPQPVGPLTREALEETLDRICDYLAEHPHLPRLIERAGLDDSRYLRGAVTRHLAPLYALGVEAMVEAVELVASGRARYVAQDESRASHQGLVTDEVARLDWSKSAVELDRWIRGCDPNPGAHARWRGETVRLFGGRLATREESGAAPGSVLTEAWDSFPDKDERIAEAVRRSPIRRMVSPDEVALAARFLCSRAASGLVGHTLVVDGGVRIVD